MHDKRTSSNGARGALVGNGTNKPKMPKATGQGQETPAAAAAKRTRGQAGLAKDSKDTVKDTDKQQGSKQNGGPVPSQPGSTKAAAKRSMSPLKEQVEVEAPAIKTTRAKKASASAEPEPTPKAAAVADAGDDAGNLPTIKQEQEPASAQQSANRKTRAGAKTQPTTESADKEAAGEQPTADEPAAGGKSVRRSGRMVPTPAAAAAATTTPAATPTAGTSKSPSAADATPAVGKSAATGGKKGKGSCTSPAAPAASAPAAKPAGKAADKGKAGSGDEPGRDAAPNSAGGAGKSSGSGAAAGSKSAGRKRKAADKDVGEGPDDKQVDDTKPEVKQEEQVEAAAAVVEAAPGGAEPGEAPPTAIRHSSRRHIKSFKVIEMEEERRVAPGPPAAAAAAAAGDASDDEPILAAKAGKGGKSAAAAPGAGKQGKAGADADVSKAKSKEAPISPKANKRIKTEGGAAAPAPAGAKPAPGPSQPSAPAKAGSAKAGAAAASGAAAAAAKKAVVGKKRKEDSDAGGPSTSALAAASAAVHPPRAAKLQPVKPAPPVPLIPPAVCTATTAAAVIGSAVEVYVNHTWDKVLLGVMPGLKLGGAPQLPILAAGVSAVGPSNKKQKTMPKAAAAAGSKVVVKIPKPGAAKAGSQMFAPPPPMLGGVPKIRISAGGKKPPGAMAGRAPQPPFKPGGAKVHAFLAQSQSASGRMLAPPPPFLGGGMHYPHHHLSTTGDYSPYDPPKHHTASSSVLAPAYTPVIPREGVLPEVALLVAAVFASITGGPTPYLHKDGVAPPDATHLARRTVHRQTSSLGGGRGSAASDGVLGREAPGPEALQGLEQPSDPRLILAKQIREALGYQIPPSFNSKTMMQTGVMEGLELEYRKREGGVKVVSNKGVIHHTLVRCYCRICGGRECINLAAFEVHAGSLYKKPADYVYLTKYGITVKDLLMLVMGEPLFNHNLHLPWPGASGVRGPGALALAGMSQSGSGQRAPRASAMAAQASLRTAAGVGPVSLEEEEEVVVLRRPRRAGPPLPAPSPMSALLPPLHIHPRNRVPDQGPTRIEPIPQTFTIDYWMHRTQQGTFVCETTADGAYMASAAKRDENGCPEPPPPAPLPPVPAVAQPAEVVKLEAEMHGGGLGGADALDAATQGQAAAHDTPDPAAALQAAVGVGAARSSSQQPSPPKDAAGQVRPPHTDTALPAAPADADAEHQPGTQAEAAQDTLQPDVLLVPADQGTHMQPDICTATTQAVLFPPGEQSGIAAEQPGGLMPPQPDLFPMQLPADTMGIASNLYLPQLPILDPLQSGFPAAGLPLPGGPMPDLLQQPPPVPAAPSLRYARPIPRCTGCCHAPAGHGAQVVRGGAWPSLGPRSHAPAAPLPLPLTLPLPHLHSPPGDQVIMMNLDGVMVPLPPHVPPPPPGFMIKATTQRNKNKHQRLFEPGEGSLRHGQHVTYSLHGQALLNGTIHMDGRGPTGIYCHHCGTVISPSTFEAHAGHRQRRNPYDAITTEEGMTLRELATRLPPLPEEVVYQYVAMEDSKAKGAGSAAAAAAVAAVAAATPYVVDAPAPAPVPAPEPEPEPYQPPPVNNASLNIRRLPAVLPGGRGGGRGRGAPALSARGRGAPGAWDSTQAADNAIGSAADAVAAPAAAPAPAAPASGGHHHHHEHLEGPQLSALTSSCVICFDASFDRDAFSDRTVLICDQCEREFHVGCLRKAGHTQLHTIPEGNWFCSQECCQVHASLTAQVDVGEMVVSNDGHTLRVMKGRDGSLATSKNLHTVLEVLQESFDPIVSSTDGMDLLPSMVLAVEHGDFDFQGMYSLLLKHRGKPVCAGLMRVFGSSMAELPLIATRLSARRQGHAKVFMSVLLDRLVMMRCRMLVLPAAHDAIVTWVRGFAMRYMPPKQLQCALAELRLLIFPGTQVLFTDLSGSPHGDAVFKGVKGSPGSLMSAHPGALPDELQAVIDAQARAIADDVEEHGLDPEPWMPPPSSAAAAIAPHPVPPPSRPALMPPPPVLAPAPQLPVLPLTAPPPPVAPAASTELTLSQNTLQMHLAAAMQAVAAGRSAMPAPPVPALQGTPAHAPTGGVASLSGPNQQQPTPATAQSLHVMTPKGAVPMQVDLPSPLDLSAAAPALQMQANGGLHMRGSQTALQSRRSLQVLMQADMQPLQDHQMSGPAFFQPPPAAMMTDPSALSMMGGVRQLQANRSSRDVTPAPMDLAHPSDAAMHAAADNVMDFLA